MNASTTQRPARRRGHVRRTFDARVQEEWGRYATEPRRRLQHALRVRFLHQHLRGVRGTVLELGPGPGRFSPALRSRVGRRVLAIDLSRQSLREARRRAGRAPRAGRIDWVQGAGECLPIASDSLDGAVVLGNIVSFAAREGPEVLRELHRALRRGAPLVIDFPSPAASLQEFFHSAAKKRALPRILRRPRFYLVHQVLDTGFQPYAPVRNARWEFRFYTVMQAEQALAEAGFHATDVMSVAPIASHQDRVAASAYRDRRTWRNLLRIEEQVGRRSGTYEAGHGFVVAAIKR